MPCFRVAFRRRSVNPSVSADAPPPLPPPPLLPPWPRGPVSSRTHAIEWTASSPPPNIQPIRRRSTVGATHASGAAFFGKRVPQAAAGASRRPVRGAALVTRAARDYYDVLGVSKAADGKELKRAYRAAVRPRHALSSFPALPKPSSAVS